MAYRADIEIAVRGAQQLRELQNQVKATSKLVDNLNNYLENIGSGGVVRSIDNLRSVVGQAAEAFNKAALGTDEARIAGEKYTAATRQLNKGLEERLLLLNQITEAERKQRLAASGINERTQYAGPIGPGQASNVALSSPLRGRLQQLIDERKGAKELESALAQLEERRRREVNATLEQKAASVALQIERQKEKFLAGSTQYGEPIGPGQASNVALSSQLRGRTEQILAERKGRTELNTVLQDQFEKQRQLENSKLDQKAAAIAAELQKQANAAKETALQTQKLSQRQQEFTQRTEESARAARAQSAEYVRQLRLQKQFLAGQTVSTVEFAPGGPGFSGGFTSGQRELANRQAILKSRREENAARRQTLELLTREQLFENRLQQILERNATLVQRRAKNREGASNAIIGGAFPLLFGQGVGASIGGGLGGFAGGRMGGQLGFGLSLVGTALGGLFDQATTSAADFSKSLRAGGDAAGYLEQRLGSLDSQTRDQIRNLQASGQTARAAELAFSELADQIGVENAQAFRELGDNTNTFSSGFQRLVTTVIAGAARLDSALKPITDRLGALSLAVPGVNAAALTRSAADFIRGQGRTPSAQPAKTPEAIQRETALRGEVSVLQQRVQLTTVSANTDLQSFVLLSRRVAKQENAVELQKIENEYKRGALTLDEMRLQKTIANLKLQQSLGDIERQRIQEERRRAEDAARAAKQAMDEQRRAYQTVISTRNQLNQAALDELRILQQGSDFVSGDVAGYKQRDILLQKTYKIQREIIVNEWMAAQAAEDYAANSATINDTFRVRLSNLDLELQYSKAVNASVRDRALLEQQLTREREKRQFNQDMAGLTMPGVVSPLDQLLINQAQRREQLLGPRFEKLDELQTNLAAPTGTFNKTELENFQQRLVVVNEEIGKITDGLVQVDAAEIAWERNRVGVEALQTAINAVGTSITNVFSDLILGTDSWNNSLRNVLNSLASTILQAGLSSLAGSDGIGFFSFLTGGLKKRATGGPVSGGESYLVGERGPELFVPGRSGAIVPNDQLGGGSTNVVVNVDAKGTKVEGDDTSSRQLGTVISAAVQAELIKQSRPGGLLASR